MHAHGDFKSINSTENNPTGCSTDWNNNFRYMMTPTQKWVQWSNTLCINAEGEDKRENPCFKLLYALACGLPICVTGIVNCTVAVPVATVGMFGCCSTAKTERDNAPKTMDMDEVKSKPLRI